MFDGFKHDIIKMSRRIGMNIIKTVYKSVSPTRTVI